MKVTAGIISLLIGLGLLVTKSHGTLLVEVVLNAQLDEPRGYCLDVVGHKEKATPERGLQTHSCYSYQGRLSVDQAFDAARIQAGEFHLPWFKACMGPSALHAGASLQLSKCDGTMMQQFDFTAQEQIVPRAAQKLCLTVAAGSATPGGGGQPVHLLRRLTLEPCSESLNMYQKWRVRGQADQR